MAASEPCLHRVAASSRRWCLPRDGTWRSVDVNLAFAGSTRLPATWRVIMGLSPHSF
jgi:hypothetical protein